MLDFLNDRQVGGVRGSSGRIGIKLVAESVIEQHLPIRKYKHPSHEGGKRRQIRVIQGRAHRGDGSFLRIEVKQFRVFVSVGGKFAQIVSPIAISFAIRTTVKYLASFTSSSCMPARLAQCLPPLQYTKSQ